MDKQSQIKKIAIGVRQWALRHRNKIDADPDLCGMCAIAAGELHKRLSAAGLDSTIALRNSSDEGHAFVICEGYIVDVTATQFGSIYRKAKADEWGRWTHLRRARAVEIVPLVPKKDRPTFWQETSQFKSVDDLIFRQKKSGWPIEQRAWKKVPREPLVDNSIWWR
jgi:hypothetical protein